MKFHIETERLILREMRPTDLEGMFELDSDPEVHKYLGNKPIKSKEESVKIIQSVIKQYKERGIGRWTAIEKSTGEFIGWSGIKLNAGEKEKLNGKTNFYDVGYRLIPKYWGKGYASESAFASLYFGFNKLNIQTMCGAAEIDNNASNKILKKIGLKFINDFILEDEKVNWYELNKSNYAKTMSRMRRQNCWKN